MTESGFAHINDISALRSLWRRSFGDDDDYIDLFLKNHFLPENTPVCRRDGRVVSQMFLLEGMLRFDSRLFSGYYIYAACTDGDYRSKGYMSSLIDFTADNAQGRNRDFLCLLPGEPSLYSYYSRFGFVDFFKKCRYRFLKSDFPDKTASRDGLDVNDSHRIFNIRTRHLDSLNHFAWDESAIDYAVTENAFSGGFSVSGEDFYAIISNTGESCRISEFVGDESSFGNLERYLMSLKFDSFVMDSPFLLDLGFPCDSVSGGMILPLSDKCKDLISSVSPCYIGLTLE